jgi:hypothetical protein
MFIVGVKVTTGVEPVSKCIPSTALPVSAWPLAVTQDEAMVRNRVLNEVLDAFSELDEAAGMEGVLKVIQGLKKKQKDLADSKA